MSENNGNHHSTNNEKSPKNNNQKTKSKKSKQFDYAEIEKMLPEEFDNLFDTLPITEETTCGWWIFKGRLMQK